MKIGSKTSEKNSQQIIALFLRQTLSGGGKSPLNYFVSLNTLLLIAFWADVYHHLPLNEVQKIHSYVTDYAESTLPPVFWTAVKETKKIKVRN